MDEFNREGAVSPRSEGIRSEVSKGFSKQSLQALGEVFDEGKPPKRIRTGAINFANDQISSQQRVARESPLLQFDIKMDSLRIFLQNMTITIGDHAKVLHEHETQFRRRCIDPQLGEVLRYIAKFTPKDAILREASRIHCQHRFIESLKDQIFKGKSEKDFKELKAGADELAQKIKLMGDAIAFLLSIRGDSEAALKDLMDALAGKADLAYVKDKLKRRKLKFHAKIEAGDDDLQQQINILKESVTAHHNEMSDKVSECEERTLDKINECNLVFREFMAEMLRRKASEEFVNKRVDNLEERVMREVDNRADRVTERVDKALDEMRKLFKERDAASGNKLSGIKNSLAELEAKISKKSDKGDLDKFILDQKLADEKINNEIGDINTFLQKHDQEFKRVFKLLKKIQDEHAAFGKRLDAAIIPQAPVQAGIPKEELDSLLSSQSKSLLSKLDNMVNRIEGLYSRVGKLESGKVDKDEIAHLKGGADLANLKAALEAKIAQMVPHAELAQLRKMLKEKANAEKTGHELTNLNERMAGYEALLKQINDEMEAFAKALAEVQDTIKSIQFTKPDVIAGTRHINCLVCGRSDRGEIILGKPKREKYVIQRRNSQIITGPDDDDMYRHVTPHTARGEARKVVLPNIKKKLSQMRSETMPEDMASSYDVDNFHMTPKQTKLGSRRESVSPTRTYGGDEGRAKSTERGGGRMAPFEQMKVQAGADLTSVKAMIRPKPY